VRALRATRIAVEAEALRLRLQARRMVTRAVLGAVAVTFLFGALAFAHVAGWYWLRLRCGWMMDSTAALLAAGDLVLAGTVALVALRIGPGRAEIEARLVRQQACRALAESAVWPVVVLRLLGLLRLWRRR
jgi:hypothetical protein